MKPILIAALTFGVVNSAAKATDLSSTQGAGSACFAAVTVTGSEGVRAIVSNVLAPANGANPSPCPVQVSFLDADGALIGEATTVQLRPAESTSVQASQPSKLVRAVVSVGDAANFASVCAIKTNLEVFDAQTGTTFVSVPGGSDRGECSAPLAPAPSVPRKSVPGQVNATAPVATFQISRRAAPLKAGSSVPANIPQKTKK